jgi:hypothetical protein
VPLEEREWLCWTNSDPVLGPEVAAIGLDHETALVAVDRRPEQDDPLELGRQALEHQPRALPYCFS